MPERLRIILAALALLALPASALGWNDRGHRTVAYVAYTNLSTAPSNNVRARVDALLKLNPSYAEWTAGVSPANRGVVAFMNASVWPDVIKDKAGYTESPKCAFAEHTNGFDDKGRHRTWHYLDLPFSFDGTPHQQQCKHNAYTIIVTFRTRLAATNAPGVPNLDREKAYDLGWLIHLVGDIHQPLHATGRFSAGTPDGDGGGNGYDIQGFTPEGANFQVRELHGFWDNVLGVDQNPTSPQAFAKVQTLANEVTSRFKQDPGGRRPPTTRRWPNGSKRVSSSADTSSTRSTGRRSGRPDRPSPRVTTSTPSRSRAIAWRWPATAWPTCSIKT